MYGIGADAERGLLRILDQVSKEIEIVMGLLGHKSIAAIGCQSLAQSYPGFATGIFGIDMNDVRKVRGESFSHAP
ncbi:MAG: hypothetical protein CM15mP60_3500 [Alphaproteobacteria bacterium]|nr:MAG: hypothetical protein CM15mP60_3500 [Alphaproteobacteria bacterium]